MDYILTSYGLIGSNSIEHHGILGMRWGVRRYQNADGTLTNAGKKRQREAWEDVKVTNKEISKYNGDIKGAYGGVTKRYRKLTDKQKKTLKKVAIGAGVAVAAVSALYFGQKFATNHMDTIIKKGTTIQNLHTDPNRMKGENFYAAYKGEDKAMYKGAFGRVGEGTMFGPQKDRNGNYTYKNVNTGVAQRDLKFASRDNGAKVYREMKKEGLTFAKDYQEFSRDSMARNGNEAKEFGRRMKAKGYTGVVDSNDAKGGQGLKANRPVIFFDNDGVKLNNNPRKVTPNENRVGKLLLIKNMLATPATAAELGGMTIAGTYLHQKNKGRKDYAKKKKYEAMQKKQIK